MSEAPSTSSVDFMRSVVSLAENDSVTPSFDGDNLFGTSRETRSLLCPTLVAGSDSQRLSDYCVESSYVYNPFQVFLNCIDTFNTKHIARFLCEKRCSNPPAAEIDEVEPESSFGEEAFDNVGFLFATPKVEEVSHILSYKIVGTRLDENAEYDKENIKIVDTSNKARQFQRLATCGFIIYDISRHPSQIAEARWALHRLLHEIHKLERWYSQSSNQVDIPTFILISTFMTWAMTKPVDPEDPGMPFREMDYKSRKCHPNFKEHFELENEVIAAGKAYPHVFKTLVVCSGVQYGCEEDTLDFLFKLAWENEPALPLYAQGRNYVPLVHVRDLSMMIFNILVQFPYKLRYLLAVEQSISNMRTVTKAISSGLTTGEIVKVSREEMLLLKVPQHVYDCLTANVRMEPQYFLELENMIWTCDSFSTNIKNIILEYKSFRRLNAIRILIIGPPASGKTTLAKRVCEYYRLHHLSQKRIVEMSIQKLKDKIDRIKAKETAVIDKAREKEKEKRLKGEEEDMDEEEVQEESGEEEWSEEVEEEGGRSEGGSGVRKLMDAIEELFQNLEYNDGRLDRETLIGCAKEILSAAPMKNQGYVLDGVTENLQELRALFDERDFIDENLDYVISLEASDDFIIDRVMELPETEMQRNGYGEEELLKRIDDYHNNNNEGTGILKFVEDNDKKPIIVQVEDDRSSFLHESFERLKEIIGEPENFVMTSHQLEKEKKMQEEHRKWIEAQDLARKQEMEKQMHTERLKKLEEWTRAMDGLRNQEEEMFAGRSTAIRNYLMKYIFPTLTKGLLEVAQRRPEDPIDFLAEYLFKYNPDGKLFAPEDSSQSRKLYATIGRDCERLFGAHADDAPTAAASDADADADADANIFEL